MRTQRESSNFRRRLYTGKISTLSIFPRCTFRDSTTLVSSMVRAQFSIRKFETRSVFSFAREIASSEREKKGCVFRLEPREILAGAEVVSEERIVLWSKVGFDGRGNRHTSRDAFFRF